MEENQAESNKKLIIISFVVLVVAAVALFYFFYLPNKQTPFEDLAEEELERSSTSIESTVSPSANPLLLTTPEATPVEKTNPFKYENPFE